MDYDKSSVPATYDQARGYDPETLQVWLDLIAAHVPPAEVNDIVDLGCGTGRYTMPLAVLYDARAVGIDPSEKMLSQAKDKCDDARISFRHGTGEALPVDDASADMVFMSMAFHHLRDASQTARECARVLRPGGRVFIRNSTQEQAQSYPHGRFFAGAADNIKKSLPRRDDVVGALQSAGFLLARHDVIPHPMAPNWQSFADKMALRADSLIAGLPDPDFEVSIAALRDHAATAPADRPVIVNVDAFSFARSRLDIR